MTVETIDIEAIGALLMTIVSVAYGVFQKVKALFANNEAASADKAAAEAAAEAETATAEKQQALLDIKTINDLMNPYVKTCEAQRQAIRDGLVDPETWKMKTETIAEVWKQLVEAGAKVSYDSVSRAVAQAEADCNTEYILRCFDCLPGTLIDDPAAFISYGTILKVCNWTTMEALAREHNEDNIYSVNG